MTTEPPPSPARRRRVRTVAARGAAMLLTALLGVYTVQTFAAVVHGPAPAAAVEPPPADPAAVVVGGEGGWRFAGSPYTLGSTDCAGAEVEAHLDAVPDPAGPSAAIGPAVRPWLSRATARPAADPRFTVHAADLFGARVRVFTLGSDRDARWVLVRIAAPTDDPDRWSIAELRPAGEITGPSFPLPAGGQRVAARVGANGRTQAELVRWSGGPAAVRSAAEAEGWTVADAESGGIACRKAGREVWVWVWSGASPDGHGLVVYGEERR